MTKTDLRERVYAAADELFVERGAFDRFGYREVRERAKGSSNDVMDLFEEWKASRAALMRSRPDALVAAAEEFAGRLWLMARLLAGGPVSQDAEMDVGERRDSNSAPRSGPPKARPAPLPGPAVRSTTKASRGPRAVLFTDVQRPERSVPKKAAAGDGISSKPAARGKVGSIKLVPPMQIKRPKATETDWRGADDERLAKAVAEALRSEGSRLRARDIWNRLLPSVRPGTAPHAQRDLQKGLSGSRIRWFKGGWFWFFGEEFPKVRPWRVDSKEARRRARGEELWWRVAVTISKVGRPFTFDEIEEACGEHLSKLGDSWLRLRLTRARKRNPPFLELTRPNIYKWTGNDPANYVKQG
ncbi:hypothetical protein [Bradyrhizobium sp.]|uniref:hypothetical protein n=1 Tax=Bradyrhizobium sp. TaxID=376 RepID=UPI0026335125|nr:hypothetical protein [Bradyrhizobium sp.]